LVAHPAGGAVDLIGSFTAWLKTQELGWVEKKLLALARTNLRNVSHLEHRSVQRHVARALGCLPGGSNTDV